MRRPQPQLPEFEGTASAKKRALFTLSLLKQATPEQRRVAMTESGLSEKAYGRILKEWELSGSIQDRPRPGRPVKYTEEIMQIAVVELIHTQPERLTGTELHAQLIEDKVLWEASDVDRFMLHLKEHVTKLGYTLLTNHSKTLFFLNKQDRIERLQHCRDYEHNLTGDQLDMCVFTDEVTLEECPHPKGVCVLHHPAMPLPIVVFNCMVLLMMLVLHT